MTTFLLANWYLVLVAFVSGGLLVWPAVVRSRQGAALSTHDAVQLINRHKAVVVDVCEPGEYAAAHVAGARSVPLAQLETATNLPTNKALPLIVVCASGARSARAVGVLKKRGHTNVHSLGGGLGAWRAANLPIEKSAEKSA